MFIDASALVGILLKEPEAIDLAARLAAVSQPFTSPITIYEVVGALMRDSRMPRSTAQELIQLTLAEAGITVIPITEEIGREAVLVFERYGKGRGHPAQLNMGDCFAYACARVMGVGILYKGDDFRQTDLR